eukprot:CAMPEP_0194319260 /NCGR_PEP_ID=MMETSP0171-20130528/15730_1 /TAXON_ID=218684 /ORGANISM="Corethron pennatum, Strain L29A3" /LENGTH=155 /DNA_ID=CAMNT_0039076413 /DNA_START=184 /DNA_END=648 /DNA_ORIENTATION=-
MSFGCADMVPATWSLCRSFSQPVSPRRRYSSQDVLSFVTRIGKRRRRRHASDTDTSASSASSLDASSSAAGHVHFSPKVRVFPGPTRADLIHHARSGGGTSPGATAETAGAAALWWSRDDYVHFRYVGRVLARTSAPHPLDGAVYRALTADDGGS